MRLFRKRLIPDEIMELRGDEILRLDEDYLVTKWVTPKPKEEFTHAASCLFLKNGYKISKIFTKSNSFKYYYCDIGRVSRPEPDSIVFTDLLLDVIVYPDGASKIDDLDQALWAHKQGIITTDDLIFSLDAMDRLLKIIYSGGFKGLARHVDGIWKEA